MPSIELSPTALAIACVIVAVAGLVPGLINRRAIWPAAAGLALFLIVLSLFEIGLTWSARIEVVVVVDRSDSARGLDDSAVEQRIGTMLGNSGYRRIDYTGGAFTPAAGADAIVLFSDGLFDPPPTAPPVYAVIPPELRAASCADARIINIEQRGDQVAATVVNDGPARALRWSTEPDRWSEVGTGRITLLATAAPGTTITAALNSGDRWPENDTMTIRTPPTSTPGRWWIGPAAPPGWTAREASAIAAAGFDLLDVEALAVINTPGEAIDLPTEMALTRYVRDFGGTLILGGRDGFAAGGWTGSAVDRLSPLASSPPTPRALWIVLLDASGSMNAPAGNGTRWERAIAAIGQAVPALPPADLVQIGSFSREVRWWHDAAVSVGDPAGARLITAPPADVTPRGPTNLQAALQAIADVPADAALARNVLVITDGEAPIDDVDELADRLRRAKVKLLALTIDPTRPSPAVARIAEATGGEHLAEPRPQAWAAAARRLAHQAGGARRLAVDTAIDLAAPLDRRVAVQTVVETWPRAGATVLGSARIAEGTVPVAATWQVGSGRVLALAFDPDRSLIDRAAAALARPPRDDRFSVRLLQGAQTIVRIEARDVPEVPALAARIIGSDRPILLERKSADRWEAALDRSPDARIVEVRAGGRVIDRIAVPARYPREFDRIGLDREKLEALAGQSGGAVLEPDDSSPIALPHRSRRVPISPYLAGAAAVAVMAGLIASRRR